MVTLIDQGRSHKLFLGSRPTQFLYQELHIQYTLSKNYQLLLHLQ